jgi:hypothetical protein
VAINANAGLFGASNYEECMNDGKVGRTDIEMQMLHLKCQKQFPKLPKLFKMKDSTILCVSSDNNKKQTFKINKDGIRIETGKLYPISVRTNETLIVKANWSINEKYPTTFTLNILDGVAELAVYETGEKYTPKYFYGCTEQ